MIEVVVVLAILALFLAFFLRAREKPAAAGVPMAEVPSKVEAPDPEEEEELEKEESKEAVPTAKPGKSFKKLKQMTKKFKKGASGPDPIHEAFLLGLKGIQSSLVDIDFVETDYHLFALGAEQ